MIYLPHNTSTIYIISITVVISQVKLNRAFRNRVSFLKEAAYSAGVDISAIIMLRTFTDYNILFVMDK